MKPCKTQTNISKKDVVKNISAPKIKAFFKTAPKNFVIDDKRNETVSSAKDSSRQFYIQELKKKLQENRCVDVQSEREDEEIENVSHEESGALAHAATGNREPNDVNQDSISSNICAGCVQLTTECNEWKAKAIELEEKYKSNQRKYAKLAIHDSELGVKYNDLLKMATSTNRPDNDEAVSSGEDVFTPNQIKFFQSMPLEKNKDSSFILQCLEYAYKTDQSVLLQKTLKGTPEWYEFTEGGEKILHPVKHPLTPKKVERIRELFIERVSKCNIDPAVYGERMKESYLNRLIASGIKNIAKKQNKTST